MPRRSSGVKRAAPEREPTAAPEPAAVVGAPGAGGVVFKSKGASKKKPKPSGGAAGVRNTKMLSFDADDEARLAAKRGEAAAKKGGGLLGFFG